MYAGVAAIGVLGFGLQAGPVYSGAAGSGPLAWPGVAGAALLLAGLLAVPARTEAGRRHRVPVAVLSVFGLLVAAMGLVDRPAGAGIGWAAVLIMVVAAAQSVLAVLALSSERPGPEQKTMPPRTEPAHSEFQPYGPGTANAVPDSYVRANAFGDAAGTGTAAAPPRSTPATTPAPSPAARGAQPNAGPSGTAQPSWGAPHAQARPPVKPVDQPARTEWPI